LRRVSGAVIGDDQQMVDVMPFHHFCKRPMPPRVFRVGEARVFLV
jgi:hypothetical protein